MKVKVIYLFLILLCVSCARIVAPTGGEKDIMAPVVKNSYPKQNTTNFNGNKIEIKFNEYIVLDNPTQKLIVSPPLKHKPNVTSKLNTLYITDIDSLQENTTYIFDFADAVMDFTENNHIPHFAFAFSTGENIDTMAYSGVVLNAYSLKTEANKYVVLYKSMDKDYQTKNIPDYITRTDSIGKFHFLNIKEGEYTLMTYEDNNQNYIYDLPTEGVGFSTQRVTSLVDSLAVKQIDTILFSYAEDTVQKLESSKLLNNRELELKFSMSVDSFQIEFISPKFKEDYYYFYYKPKQDSNKVVKVFAGKEYTFDTLECIVKTSKGFEEKVEKYTKRSRGKKEERKRFSFSAPPTTYPYYEKLTLKIPFIQDIYKQVFPAYLISENDTTKIIFTNDGAKDWNSYVSYHKLKPSTEYTLKIDSCVVNDFRDYKNDSAWFIFKVDSPDDYGSLILSLFDDNPTEKQIILSLFDVSNKQVGEDIIVKSNDKNIVFEHLKEGSYKVRAIIDENSNGKWDRNDYFSNRQAEKVIFFPKRINVRNSWVSEEDWKISY
ncbi:MAG: Ig-like domain-containing protein [Bacteroidales bacterium]|nr:Ig-like domain-containing protein [Bacteroidales bacterium]